MSTLCLKYYNFLENSLDLEYILDNLKEANDNLMSWSLNHDFINCKVQDLLDSLPKFLNYSIFRDINKKASGYNHNKIYNATMLNAEQLNNKISRSPSIIQLQNKIKRTPIYLDDQIKEYTLQTNYLNNIDDYIFNKNLFIYNHKSANYPKEFSNLLVKKTQDEIVEDSFRDQSFFHIYFLKTLINSIFYNRSTLRDTLLINSKNFVLPDISNSFDSYCESIVDVVLINQFSFSKIDTSFKERLYESDSIKDSIMDVNNLFNDYISENSKSFKFNIAESFFDIFNHALSLDLLKTIHRDNRTFDFNMINSINYNFFSDTEVNDLVQLYMPDIELISNTINDFENAVYLFHIDVLNKDYLLENYYSLLYLYRGRLQKFVSLIDPVSVEYIVNNIDIYSVPYFNNFNHLNSLYGEWITAINYDSFTSYLNDYFLTINTYFADNYDKLLKFVLVYEYRKLIRKFVDTDVFKKKVIDIHQNIYSYLRTNGILKSDTDWCGCIRPLELYLFFVLNNIVEDVSIETLYNYVQDHIENSVLKSFENEGEFNIFIKSFRENYCYNLFEFYKNFVTSLVSLNFSETTHRKFGI